MIQYVQLPHLGTETFRNGVPICRDGLPASGGGRELLRFHPHACQGQADVNGDARPATPLSLSQGIELVVTTQL